MRKLLILFLAFMVISCDNDNQELNSESNTVFHTAKENPITYDFNFKKKYPELYLETEEFHKGLGSAVTRSSFEFKDIDFNTYLVFSPKPNHMIFSMKMDIKNTSSVFNFIIDANFETGKNHSYLMQYTSSEMNLNEEMNISPNLHNFSGTIEKKSFTESRNTGGVSLVDCFVLLFENGKLINEEGSLPTNVSNTSNTNNDGGVSDGGVNTSGNDAGGTEGGGQGSGGGEGSSGGGVPWCLELYCSKDFCCKNEHVCIYEDFCDHGTECGYVTYYLLQPCSDGQGGGTPGPNDHAFTTNGMADCFELFFGVPFNPGLDIGGDLESFLEDVIPDEEKRKKVTCIAELMGIQSGPQASSILLQNLDLTLILADLVGCPSPSEDNELLQQNLDYLTELSEFNQNSIPSIGFLQAWQIITIDCKVDGNLDVECASEKLVDQLAFLNTEQKNALKDTQGFGIAASHFYFANSLDANREAIISSITNLAMENSLPTSAIPAGINPDDILQMLKYSEAYWIKKKQWEKENPGKECDDDNWCNFTAHLSALKSAIAESSHTFFDICSLFEGPGIVCDALNSIQYVIEGDGTEATFALASMIPGVSWFQAGRRWKKVIKLADGKTAHVALWVDDATNYIKFSHNDSQGYRKLWGITDSNIQGHHLIPKTFVNHPVVQKAAKFKNAPFHMNDIPNGKGISKLYHNGSHPDYSTFIGNKLNELGQQGHNEEKLAEILANWQTLLRNKIDEFPTTNINEIPMPVLPMN